MQIAKFLSSVLPSFGRDRIETDLNMCSEEFNEYVLPVYKSFEKAFSQYQFQSPALKSFEEVYRNSLETPNTGNGNFVSQQWSASIKFIPEKIGLIRGALENTPTGDFIREALNARQINVVQVSEILSFMVRFSRRFLNYVITVETNFLNGKEENNGLIPAEVEWINKYYSSYMVGLNFLRTKKGKVTELLDKVPDVLINKANSTEVQAMSGDSVDPFKMGFIPLALNPIYHIGLRVAEYQAARYHEAKYEEQAIANKIMYLQKRMNDQNDAKLEHVIDNYQKILNKKTHEIAMMEEKYANK